MPTIEAARAGEWIVPDVSYVEPSRRFCAYCGRPIARRYWRECTPAGVLTFCQPAHAAMLVDATTRSAAAGTGADTTRADGDSPSSSSAFANKEG